jgi:hypothetical protein
LLTGPVELGAFDEEMSESWWDIPPCGSLSTGLLKEAHQVRRVRWVGVVHWKIEFTSFAKNEDGECGRKFTNWLIKLEARGKVGKSGRELIYWFVEAASSTK